MVLLLILAGISLFIGSRDIPINVSLDAIVAFDSSNSAHLLVQHIRIPRTILAIVVGCALGVAGTVMQALTRNPLADPGILGVNAGAALAIVCGITLFGVTTTQAYMWFGLLGASIAGGGVYLLAGIRGGINPVLVVLAGSAFSVVMLAMTHVITLNSENEVLDMFRHWAVGALQGRGYDVLIPVSVLVAVGCAIAFILSGALDTVSLGEDIGQALGAEPIKVWSLSAIAVIVLAGAATSAAGPISFVGLTAPHIARLLVGPGHDWLLPYAMVIAAILLLGADIAGRIIGHPSEIGVGIMVALIGGPFFVFLVRRWKINQL
ncbi:FecCD family ABC transporter permease [Thaumasiovibrio subtropicus]|nr:iron ABC transporter permease [Thaumasiovibrio subtropicus]